MSTKTLFEDEVSRAEKQKRYSLGSVCCKICFDATKPEEPITPCLCKGSIGKVHLSCLESWLAASNSHLCELCGYQFMINRKPRYGIMESLLRLYFKEKDMLIIGTIRFDLATLLFLTPTSYVCIYLCITTAVAFGSKSDEVGSLWGNFAMTLIAALVGLGYYFWATEILRRHFNIWYRYWQAHNIVHLLNPNESPQSPPTQFAHSQTAQMPSTSASQSNAGPTSHLRSTPLQPSCTYHTSFV